MNVVVVGSTGMIGSRITTELERRGHSVTGANRSTGADITAPEALATIAPDADAIVSAVAARGVDYTLADVAGSLIEAARNAGVQRVVVVGGAGSLEIAPGVRLVDTPEFPTEWKPEALQQVDALQVYRRVDDLDWTVVSPAASIHPGRRTGSYRLGGDNLLVDDDGNSEISAEDFAVGIADLLERNDHRRERITVAW